MESLTIIDIRTISMIIDAYNSQLKDVETKQIVTKYSEKLHKILKEYKK